MVHKACYIKVRLILKILTEKLLFFWYLSCPVVPAVLLEKLFFCPPFGTFFSGGPDGKGCWFYSVVMFQKSSLDFCLECISHGFEIYL